ncbi:MAG: T9SS type A sorting domain-containing protein, partial [Bacteroidota bacterium]|nr:T9SS type A sorting domain-containing protein [Bacteroidota bacterium]
VATIVATKQNRQPYMGTVDLIVNNAPFVVYLEHTIDDSLANNNGNADFLENVFLDVTLNNLGNVNANNINAVLSTTDTCITILQDSANYGNIAASSNMNLSAAYELSIAAYFEDQYNVPFTIDVSDGTDTWTSNFSIQIFSPKMEIENISFNDSIGGNNNHRFDAGEVIFVTHYVNNIGYAASQDAFSYISSTSSFIDILTDSVAVGTLNPGLPVQVVSTIIIDPATPIGELVDIDFNLISGLYIDDDFLEAKVGLIAEDWESNSFLSYTWQNNSTVPWHITSAETYEGNFATQSGAIGNNASTVLEITVDVAVADDISFYKKVSCEDPGWDYYDFLEFFIDGTSMDQWGGEVDWSQETYPLTTGTHTLKWSYEKDGYATGGADCAWIDLIEFPLLNGMQNNTPPEFTSTDSTNAVKGTPYSYTLTTYDADGDNVDLFSVTLPTWLTFTNNGNGTGTLSGTPTANDIYTHQVIISANDGNGFTPHPFEIKVEAIVGISDIASPRQFNIYPNPTNGITNISYSLNKNSNVKFTIYNSLGEIVFAPVNNQEKQSGRHNLAIDMKDYDAGIYFCRLETNGFVSTRKIVLTKR